MKFREETIQEFNSYCDTTLTKDMTFAEVVDNIDSANNNYFYVSMCKMMLLKQLIMKKK